MLCMNSVEKWDGRIKMHCYICDDLLNDWEATLKSTVTGDYLDMCASCLASAEIVCTPDPNTIWDKDIEIELEND